MKQFASMLWLNVNAYRSVLSHAAQCDVLGTETKHDENHQRGQNRRHEVDAGDHECVPVAVVVHWIVGGICDNGAIAQSEGKKHLCSSLPPHLHVTPDFKLDKGNKMLILISHTKKNFKYAL